MPTYLFPNLTVQIETGDITRENVDAIVNAANPRLEYDGGVAAAIVSQGGNVIQQESNEWVKLHGLVSLDRPAITGAGSLPCRYIIHAVGPVWGEGHEIYKLHTAIYSSLVTANDLKCASVAFPAISSGLFGFPLEPAAHCFLLAIQEFSSLNILFFTQTVKIVLFSDHAFQIFRDQFSNNESNSL
jgi:O-acetyl-ADP-ribose deacetylase